MRYAGNTTAESVMTPALLTHLAHAELELANARVNEHLAKRHQIWSMDSLGGDIVQEGIGHAWTIATNDPDPQVQAWRARLRDVIPRSRGRHTTDGAWTLRQYLSPETRTPDARLIHGHLTSAQTTVSYPASGFEVLRQLSFVSVPSDELNLRYTKPEVLALLCWAPDESVRAQAQQNLWMLAPTRMAVMVPRLVDPAEGFGPAGVRVSLLMTMLASPHLKPEEKERLIRAIPGAVSTMGAEATPVARRHATTITREHQPSKLSPCGGADGPLSETTTPAQPPVRHR
jgi:hypothetical protein